MYVYSVNGSWSFCKLLRTEDTSGFEDSATLHGKMWKHQQKTRKPMLPTDSNSYTMELPWNSLPQDDSESCMTSYGGASVDVRS